MATLSSNEVMCKISEVLYTLVNAEIGQERQVKLRRQIYDLINVFDSCNGENSRTISIMGSTAEGFNFTSSDLDLMGIDNSVLVIDTEQRKFFKTTCFPFVFLMECDNVQPGFVLLKCIKYDSRAQKNYVIDSALLPRENDCYLSSLKVREIDLIGTESNVHGPCRSDIIHGTECDYVYTLKLPFWPKPAKSFIHRSIRNEWPTAGDLINICTDGCYLVPIHCKHQSVFDQDDLQWRISFSMAEKKLIYSMNHCQFLCYGLMKIFLNEVLKALPETKTWNYQSDDNVLCSYYMKTAVFWEISESVNNWTKQNFINKSMNVFRRIIKWVALGYCPNFFIPENNMFTGKIIGRRQRELVIRLRSLYDEGFSCFLHCNSLDNVLSNLILERLPMSILQTDVFHDTADETETISMIVGVSRVHNQRYSISVLEKTLMHTATLKPSSHEMISPIKLRINFILQWIAIIYSKLGIPANKSQYMYTMRARSILRKTKTCYCLSEILLAAILYMNGEYYKTIEIVKHIQRKLQSQTTMYTSDFDMAIIMRCRQRGMQYEDIVKAFVISHSTYIPEIPIHELLPEFSVVSYIPPLVFLNFLLIVSYTRLDKSLDRKRALDNLLSIIYRDKNHHIKIYFKATSWQILGICQQLCCYYRGAYQSYVNALNDEYNDFREFTILRILTILNIYLTNNSE